LEKEKKDHPCYYQELLNCDGKHSESWFLDGFSFLPVLCQCLFVWDFFWEGEIRVLTQDFMLSKQVVYHLSHASSPLSVFTQLNIHDCLH
jgi:hypothetical protein